MTWCGHQLEEEVVRATSGMQHVGAVSVSLCHARARRALPDDDHRLPESPGGAELLEQVPGCAGSALRHPSGRLLTTLAVSTGSAERGDWSPAPPVGLAARR